MHLMDRKIVTPGEAGIMRAAVGRNALALPVSAKDILRAAILRSMILQIFKSIEGDE